MVYDLIETRGKDGITVDFLRECISHRKGKRTGPHAVVMSVRRINEMFEDVGARARIKNYRVAANVNWRIGAKHQKGRIWNYFYYVETF